jgi:hypothetical protein
MICRRLTSIDCDDVYDQRHWDSIPDSMADSAQEAYKTETETSVFQEYTHHKRRKRGGHAKSSVEGKQPQHRVRVWVVFLRPHNWF